MQQFDGSTNDIDNARRIPFDFDEFRADNCPSISSKSRQFLGELFANRQQEVELAWISLVRRKEREAIAADGHDELFEEWVH